METVRDFIFRAPKSLQMVTAVMKLKETCCLEEKLCLTQTADYKAETLLCQQGLSSQSCCFASNNCGCESQTIKKAEL